MLTIHKHWPARIRTIPKYEENYLLNTVNLNYMMPAMEIVHLL